MEVESGEVTSCEDWISFEWIPLDGLAAANLLPVDFQRLSDWPGVFFKP